MANLFADVFKKAIIVLFYPKEWFMKVEKDYASNQFLTIYVGILGLIPAIGRFFSLALIPSPEGTRLVVTNKTILLPVLFLVMIMVSFWIITWLIFIFAKRMTGMKSVNTVAKIVAYSLTPVLLSPIFGPIPVMNWVMSFFLLIYSVILLIIGIAVVLEPGVYGFFLYIVSILFFLFFLIIDEYVMTLLA